MVVDLAIQGEHAPAQAGLVPIVRKVRNADVMDALRHGYADFKLMPTYLVLLALIYPVIGIVAGRAAMGNNLLPLVFPLVSGFALVGPIAGLGLYELSRRHEAGLPTTWANMFDVLKSPALGTIVALALLLLALFIGWLFAAMAIYRGVFGDAAPANVSAFVQDVTTTSAGLRLIVIGNAVGFLFAAAVFLVSAVSFPLALDRRVNFATAVGTSIRAVTQNPGPMAVWGLIIALSLGLGGLLLFTGLAVAIPVLGHATWHLYRKVIA